MGREKLGLTIQLGTRVEELESAGDRPEEARDPLSHAAAAELDAGAREIGVVHLNVLVRAHFDVGAWDEAAAVAGQAQILALLDELQRTLGLTYLFVSHDLAVVQQISDTVSVMHKGRQVDGGSIEAVFVAPDFELYRSRSRELMGVLRAHVEKVEVVGLDEAYLDLTGLDRPRAAARRLKEAVRARTGRS